ncbi:MAG: L17 family ribosomal protein [Bacilli bacterium]|nr:L17 family ribosomal protein [Bacilli bacterium]
MKVFGRKNVRGKGGVRFKARYNKARKEAMQRNIVTEFILHEKMIITSGVLRKFKKNVDRIITYAKNNKYRLVHAFLRSEKGEDGTKAINKLFHTIVPRFKERNGGYVKHFRYINRKGDGAKQIVVKFAN